jgi:hypothetical protein
MIEREYILADPGSLFFAKRSVTCPCYRKDVVSSYSRFA